MTITESGMEFGDFSDKEIFRIENSETQKLAQSPPVVEFIYSKSTNKLIFLEAKSSSPQEKTNKERYNEFINEITDKFICSFDMYMASKLKRYNEIKSLNNDIQKTDDSIAEYQFVLVINGHQLDWLVPLQAEFERKLVNHKKIWKSKVIVINEVLAEKMKLINQ